MYDTLIKEGTAPIVSINILPLVRHVGGLAETYEKGAHFVITPRQSVPSRYIDPKVKNHSRLNYQIANLQAAHMEEGAMALLTDELGFITEGTGNNFFIAREGKNFTPKPHNILRGVTRQTCMDLAANLGIPLTESDLDPYDVRTADEAWSKEVGVNIISQAKKYAIQAKTRAP